MGEGCQELLAAPIQRVQLGNRLAVEAKVSRSGEE
jgi:hypothetical protein